MCKQALWLAPAPPACTPNHHNHNAINYYKQNSSSLGMKKKNPDLNWVVLIAVERITAGLKKTMLLWSLPSTKLFIYLFML